ncbi:MAG TPA: AarF/UbiB family protein [Kofleriaceae bacterium]|nr:AarF/UbiB family protein [Kofleriaceae bacterium]
MSERTKAEAKIGLARFFARAKQILTTDPTGSDEDDRVVEEATAQALARHAAQHKGGMAKVAQLAAYDPLGALGEGSGAGRSALANLWDRAPGVTAAEVSRVIEEDLGAPPQQLFASWDPNPIAAASLGQVHAATGKDGSEYAVKIQYPAIAAALREDVASEAFVRKLAGSEVGATLDGAALEALRAAVLGELDYRAEAAACEKFRAAWAGDEAIVVPRVETSLSSARVLTMERLRGMTLVETASADADTRAQAAAAIFRFAYGSPLVHGLLNADPNPGNYLVARAGDRVKVGFLDFGCAVPLAPELAAGDKELWYGILHDDAFAGAERFRMGLAHMKLLRRADALHSTAHRDWERALATPFAGAAPFHWTRGYAADLARSTRRALAAGGLGLPAGVVLLWRARLGVASVLAMLDSSLPFRRLLVDLIGLGRAALR